MIWLGAWILAGSGATLFAHYRSGPLRWPEVAMFMLIGPIVWLAIGIAWWDAQRWRAKQNKAR